MTCCAGYVYVPIQPATPVLVHADYTAPTRQHWLDHTDKESI